MKLIPTVVTAIVAFLLSAWPAAAQPIVRLNFADVPLQYGGAGISLDLDGDGRIDARLYGAVPCGQCVPSILLQSVGNSGAQFRTRPSYGLQCGALGPGELNGPSSGRWSNLVGLGEDCAGLFSTGLWCGLFEGYVGYRLDGPGAIYGWLRIANTTGDLNGIVLREGAFNAGGGPIYAGEGSAYTLPPSFSVPGGEYEDYLSVELATPTPGATIRYTLDGSTPGPASPVFTPGSPLRITQTGTTLRAYASRDDLLDSPPVAATYSLQAGIPAMDPPVWNTPSTVSLVSSTPGAAIYFTLDGTPPSADNGTLYGAPLSLTGQVTLTARAFKPGLTPSRELSRRLVPPTVICTDPDDVPIAPGAWVPIDIDGDGQPDTWFFQAPDGVLAVAAIVLGDYRYLGNTIPYVDRLAPGAVVSAEGQFVFVACDFECFEPTLCDRARNVGVWCEPASEGYLGVAMFLPDGRARYAWVRVRTPSAPGQPAYVLDWAFHGAPGAPIVVGDRGDQLGCPADMNADGVLDPDDLSDFITCYFAAPPCSAADYDRDGQADPDDLADYIAAYFAGC